MHRTSVSQQGKANATQFGRGAISERFAKRFIWPLPVLLRKVASGEAGIGGIGLALFFRQMAMTIDMGLPVLEALRFQAESTGGSWRRLYLSLGNQLESGEGMADAMMAHPKVFRPLMIEIIRAGEHTGTVGKAFERCASYIEADLVLRRRLKGAAIYPFMVALMAVLSGVYLAFKVLPEIAQIFMGLGVSLPVPTRVLLGIVSFLQLHARPCLTGFFLWVPVVFLAVRAGRGRMVTDRFLLYCPGLSWVARNSAASRFARTLAEGLTAGLPLPTVLELSARAMGNTYMEQRLRTTIPLVLSGATLDEAFGAIKLFPPTFRQVIAMGERTGTLTQMLETVSEFYGAEADHSVKSIAIVLEPALILLVAVLIGFLAASVVLPIYSMLDYV